jgi:hypothetical protein
MRIEHELSPVVKKWLKGTKHSPYTAQQTVGQVMKSLPQTPQGRRHRWSFRWRRRPKTTASRVAAPDLKPSPIPAPSGHPPTVTGSTQSMFSPAKAITAGALVFAIGGVLLIAQPFDQQGGSVPGAATDDASVAMSTFTWLEGDDGLFDAWGPGPVSVTDEGLLLQEHVEFGFIVTTDPRISGEMVTTYNGFLFDEETGAGEYGVLVGKKIIANAGGRWIETDMGHFEGVDGYAGLTAVFRDGPEGEREGVIFPGDMPPTPKDWCQLAREDLAAATSRILDDEAGDVKDRTSRLCPSLEIPE